MNNLLSYDVKKDLRFEIIENKKGIFSTTKKFLFKTITVEDLTDWVRIFDLILKK